LRVSMASLYVALHPENSCVIGRFLPGNFEFRESRLIIQMSSIEIFRFGQVRFARIGAETKCRFDGLFRQCETRRRVVVAKKVKKTMSKGEFTIGLEERWIAGDCLVEQIDRLQQLRFATRGRTHP